MSNSYDKFTANFKKVIQKGAWICLNELKKAITPTHLFLGILAVPESLAFGLLKSNGIKRFSLDEYSAFDAGKKLASINASVEYSQVFSLSMDKETVKILESAADIAIAYKHSSIGTEHLLAAMAELKSPPLVEYVKSTPILLEKLRQDVHTVLANKNGLPRPADSKQQENKSAAPSKHATLSKVKEKRSEHTLGPIKKTLQPTPALDYFTTDLTAEEYQKNSYPLIGREKEMARLTNILSRKTKNNPLLLGEPGVGKTALVEGLAQKIYQGKVPDILASKKILALDLNALVAGTMYRGEFESRLKQIIEEVTQQDDIILFIDEIHTMVGAGSASGSLDAANILKPYLARGELSCIGSTTFTEFKSHFESDATLERRFQSIIIEEPTNAETLEIVRGVKPKLEDYHGVAITEESIEAAIDLSARFLPHKYFPDKAIDLLDEAASRIKVANTTDSYGKKTRRVRELLKKITFQKESAVKEENFSAAIVFKTKEESHLKKLLRLKIRRQKKNTREKIGVIKKEDIVRVVTDMVKIPFLEMANLDAHKLLALQDTLGKRVLGQKAVLESIAKTLRRAHVGLADPKRPLASFIFLGPSGVGKTETAKTIAEEIFGDKKALIRINMSEFQESFNISKLIGAPAGYVGYKDATQLADRVRSKPYAVVLFDEMEKAHPDVFNLLLQVLEDGYLLDASGKHINFKNTVIIFTSNIGLERLNQTQQLGFSAHTENQKERIKKRFAELKEHILEELHNTYRVEFLNRIDKILVFEPLTANVVAKIVSLNIGELNNKLTDKSMRVELSAPAKKILARLSFSPDDGARSVRRVVQEHIEELLVEQLLKGLIKHGDTVKVEAKGQKILLKKWLQN